MIIFDRKTVRAAASILAITAALSAARAANAQTNGVIALDIPAENTARALNDFAKAAQIHLLFPYDAATKYTAPALAGTFTRDEALARLIAGTDLEVASESGDTITLRERAVAGAASEPATQVTVTGSRIRDASPTSPVIVIGRKDIDRSGYSQVGDLMRSLPENFAGGQNPGVIDGDETNVENNNASNASTVNLRGLGTGATLVLLNGHRLSADTIYQGSDISAIPMAALERVEVVPDGASALYGSDAVAGVVNFIIRKDYNGNEASARIGESADGGGEERTFNVLSGTAGSNWHLLGDLQYTDQSPVDWGQRSFISTDLPQNTLLEGEAQRSLYIGGGVDLFQGAELSFDLLGGDRTNSKTMAYAPGTTQYLTDFYTMEHSGAVTLDLDLNDNWKGHVTGVSSASINESTEWYAPGAAARGRASNRVQYVEASADGRLFTLPSGVVSGAFGAGYRTEGFVGTENSGSRTVSYAFGEALIPLVAKSDTRTGLHSLELDVSGRAEHYSDFGNGANPKVGLRYVPFSDLVIRSTWGKSLKAPSFTQLYTAPEVDYFNVTDLGGTGSGTAILTSGGNPNLKAEKSTSWTFGADYTPDFLPSAKLSATYFNIDYRDRVVQPVANVAAGLSDPVYATFVEQDPSQARINQIVSSTPNFYNWTSGAFDPTQVVDILHDEYQNATAQTVRGIDLSYNQSFDLGEGRLETFANASKIKLEQRSSPLAPEVVLSGTLFSTPDFRARGGLTYEVGGWAVTAIANFTDGEADTGTTPTTPIASWTTVDANLSYSFRSETGLSHGVKLDLAISNLFDKAPPYTVSPTDGPNPHFDSANASAMGRFVSLTVTKDW